MLLISTAAVGMFVLSSSGPEAAAADASRPKTLQVDGVSYSLDIEIAAGAAGDKTLADGVYLFHLKCSADISCELERTTLNECTKTREGAPAFLPRLASWVTWTSQLEVRQIASHEIELTVYQAFGKKLPAKMLLTFVAGKSPPFEELTGLRTTGFIDLRFWPDLDKKIEYVPVQNDRAKVLDCPVSLRGLKR